MTVLKNASDFIDWTFPQAPGAVPINTNTTPTTSPIAAETTGGGKKRAKSAEGVTDKRRSHSDTGKALFKHGQRAVASANAYQKHEVKFATPKLHAEPAYADGKKVSLVQLNEAVSTICMFMEQKRAGLQYSSPEILADTALYSFFRPPCDANFTAGTQCLGGDKQLFEDILIPIVDSFHPLPVAKSSRRKRSHAGVAKAAEEGNDA